MIGATALLELRRLRAGMMFWILLAFGQLIIAWLGFSQLEVFAEIAPQLKAAGSALGVIDLVIMPTFNSLVLVLLLSVPLLAMGSLAGETHSGRMALWLSSPVSGGQMVLGKILGLWLSSLPLVVSATLTLAAFGLGVDLDWPRFALATGCMLLFSLWLASLTLFISGLFDRPAAALAASYGVLVFMWLLDSFSSPGAPWHWFALLPHIEPSLQGLLRSQDLIFFTATAAAAALLGTYSLARRRGEV
jgi:ABC-2 type transport system permease protein